MSHTVVFLLDLWHDDEPEGLQRVVCEIRDIIRPSMLQLYVSCSFDDVCCVSGVCL